METRKIAITCHDNAVPVYAEAELERLYGNIFSTLLQHRTYGLQTEQMSTYAVWVGNELVALYLFLCDANKVVVLNEGITIGSVELARFCSYIFGRYAAVDVICFKAIQTNVRKLPFPHQRVNYLEDLVLALPETVEGYLARLAGNTRRNIKRCMERLQRDFPSFRFKLYTKAELDEQDIRAVIAFNRLRMAKKNIDSAIDEQETQRIVKIVKSCGAVGVITIDGRVCAGAISYRTGDNYFLNVLAHDPRYDAYGLGILCCYLTICECIRRGGAEFHFLWGRYDYKQAFLAEQRDLDRIAVYRSRRHFLLNARLAIRLAFDGYVRKIKLWVMNENSLISSFALMAVMCLRSINRRVSRLASWRTRIRLQKVQEE